MVSSLRRHRRPGPWLPQRWPPGLEFHSSPGPGTAAPAPTRSTARTSPWTKDNFPVLNERGLAYQKVFDEALAPKYDCVPSSSPAIQYDPYDMQVMQWPDRVVFRYEKDDQTRTVWLDGRKPTIRLTAAGLLGRPLRGQRAHRRHRSLPLRHHRLRRLQRHPLVAVEEGHRDATGARATSCGDADGRGSAVPAAAGVVHDAVAAGPARLPSCRLGLRPRNLAGAGQDDGSEEYKD